MRKLSSCLFIYFCNFHSVDFSTIFHKTKNAYAGKVFESSLQTKQQRAVESAADITA